MIFIPRLSPRSLDLLWPGTLDDISFLWFHPVDPSRSKKGNPQVQYQSLSFKCSEMFSSQKKWSQTQPLRGREC